MTKYTPQDYGWVHNTIKRHKSGISPNEIVQASQEESKMLGSRPRDEKPPGRDKIYKILNDGADTHWDYIVGGGRSKTSRVVVRDHDPMTGLGTALMHMRIQEDMKHLNEIYHKRDRKLGLKALLELARIRHVIISYPMHAYYSGNLSDNERDLVFQTALESAKRQLVKIKAIERMQKKKYSDYEEIRNAIDKLRHGDLISYEIFPDRQNYKEHLKHRNFLRQRFKL